MKILILGHRGMLGNALARYLSNIDGCETLTLTSRYPDPSFVQEIKNSNPDFIVNCIGAIPQKKPSAEEYKLLNEDLPKQLDTIGIPVIHPSTDCEFAGDLPVGQAYDRDHKRDAVDEYGQSKARISLWVEEEAKNTKIIRTSILGHELSSTFSLLDWFLSQNTTVNGYTDQYWNGITTLEWAKQCLNVIRNWGKAKHLTQFATPNCVSKYDLLKIFAEVYEKNVEIRPTLSGKQSNKCLTSDTALSPINEQLFELKTFYGK